MNEIPKDVVAVIEPSIAIKDILLDLSESNLQQSISQIIESKYLSSTESKKRFFDHLIDTVMIRTKNIDQYVKLSLDLHKLGLIILDLSCLDSLIVKKYTYKRDQQYIHPAVYFIYLLYKELDLNFDDLMRQFFSEYLPVLWVDYIELTSVLFFWFIFEIKEKCTFKNYKISRKIQEHAGNFENELEPINVFDKMTWSAETDMQIDYHNGNDSNYEFKNADFDYIRKEWNKRSECRIYNIIANDDAESLQEIASNPEFSINMRIEKFEYEPNAMIKSNGEREGQEISLVALSAYFGSIKCFKYLITNNANEEDVMAFAIAGGNIEIIRLCEKMTRDWEIAASIAVRYHMNDVFEWIFDNYLDKTNDHDFFIDCAISNNIKLTYFLVSHGLSPKSTIKINEWPKIFYDAHDYAANNGSKEVLSILEQLPRPKKSETAK